MVKILHKPTIKYIPEFDRWVFFARLVGRDSEWIVMKRTWEGAMKSCRAFYNYIKGQTESNRRRSW